MRLRPDTTRPSPKNISEAEDIMYEVRLDMLENNPLCMKYEHQDEDLSQLLKFKLQS